MKKKDGVLIGGILLLALLCWLVPKGQRFFDKDRQTEVKITVGGEVYGTYSLEEDRIIEIQDTNICEIKDKKVEDDRGKLPGSCVYSPGNY